MTIAVADAVRCTSGVSPGQVHGLWTSRTRVRAGRCDVWIETPLCATQAYERVSAAARIAAVASLVRPGVTRWLLLPNVRALAATGRFVHGRAPVGTVLLDRMESGPACAAVEAAFATAGARLAELHATPLESAATSALPRRRPPLDESAPASSPGGVGDAMLRACVDLCGGIASVLRQRPEVDERGDVLLHGRWSSGTLISPDEDPRKLLALGGSDCWIGPPEVDVGYLLGELVELAAEGLLTGDGARRERAWTFARKFLGCYRSTRTVEDERLVASAIRRVVSHLAANLAWRPIAGLPMPTPRELIALTTAYEQLIPELRNALR